MPLPLSVQVSPCGRVPASASVGAGAPVVFTVKVKPEPSVALAVAAARDRRLGAVTVRTNDWVVVPPVFFAVNVIG